MVTSRFARRIMETTLVITSGILLGCLLALSWFAGSDAPYVPTKMARIKKILKLSGLKNKEIFYELGSGDGRVVIEAAKIGATSFGIEQSWLRIFWSRWKARNLKNAHFFHGNIFNVILRAKPEGYNHILRFAQNDIYNADVVFIFLLLKGVAKLEPLLRKKLKKGSRVITQTFHFEHWRPYKKILITNEDQPNTLLGKNQYEGDFWIYRV